MLLETGTPYKSHQGGIILLQITRAGRSWYREVNFNNIIFFIIREFHKINHKTKIWFFHRIENNIHYLKIL